MLVEAGGFANPQKFKNEQKHKSSNYSVQIVV